LSEQHEQNLHTKSNQQLCSSGDTHGTDNLMIFTARSTYVRSAILLWECRLSVRPSVTLVDCDHINWGQLECNFKN